MMLSQARCALSLCFGTWPIKSFGRGIRFFTIGNASNSPFQPRWFWIQRLHLLRYHDWKNKTHYKEVYERRTEDRSNVLYQNTIQDGWKEGEVVVVPYYNSLRLGCGLRSQLEQGFIWVLRDIGCEENV